MKIVFFHILLFLSSLSVIFCGDTKNSIFDIIVRDPKLEILTQYLEQFNLTHHVKELDDATVFAPLNKAFGDGNGSSITTKQQLLYHIVKPAYTSDDLKDGMLLTTDTDSQLLTKITKKKGVLYVGNTARVEKENIKATNGYVHTIDQALFLPSDLGETIASHPDLTDFSKKLTISGIEKELKNKQAQYTVFAIKGDIFDDDKLLDPLQKSYLQTPGAKKDIARLLNYLIVPGTYYTTDLKKGKTVLKTIDGSEDLEVFKKDSEITVNGIKVVEQDILSSNGVVHILEHPLLPKHMSDFLKMNARKGLLGMNHGSRFIDLFDQYNLSTYLDNENDVISLLAPPDDSLDEHLVPKYKMENWLTYHIIQGFYTPDTLNDHQLLLTASHDDMGPDRYQRIKVHVDNPLPFKDQSRLMLDGPSIQFGKVNTLGEPVRVSDNLIIYRIVHSLHLPRDPLIRLVSNHDLFTFFGSAYMSHSDKVITDAAGMTLFVPTNEAFHRLGLISKFLLQPGSQDKLATVVTYHAVHGLFYTDEMTQGQHREPTLAGPEIQINKTNLGTIYLGPPHALTGDNEGRELVAKVDEKDTLIANGVMHVIDRVQLPSNLIITNRDLLSADDFQSFLTLLSKTDLAKQVLDAKKKKKDQDAFTILAPSDRAFSKIDLSELLNDHDKLEELVRLHIIPDRFPGLVYDDMVSGGHLKDNQIGFSGVDFNTMLENYPVVISKNLRGGYSVGIKTSFGLGQTSAYITDFGRSSSGGGVIVIDRVLVPTDIQGAVNQSIPWWGYVLIAIGVLVVLILLALAAYSAWQWYSNREGQIGLPPNN